MLLDATSNWTCWGVLPKELEEYICVVAEMLVQCQRTTENPVTMSCGERCAANNGVDIRDGQCNENIDLSSEGGNVTTFHWTGAEVVYVEKVAQVEDGRAAVEGGK